MKQHLISKTQSEKKARNIARIIAMKIDDEICLIESFYKSIKKKKQ